MMQHSYVNANKSSATVLPMMTATIRNSVQKEHFRRQSLNHGKAIDAKITADEAVEAGVETTIGATTIAIAAVATFTIITIRTIITDRTIAIADKMEMIVIEAPRLHIAIDRTKRWTGANHLFIYCKRNEGLAFHLFSVWKSIVKFCSFIIE